MCPEYLIVLAESRYLRFYQHNISNKSKNHFLALPVIRQLPFVTYLPTYLEKVHLYHLPWSNW